MVVRMKKFFFIFLMIIILTGCQEKKNDVKKDTNESKTVENTKIGEYDLAINLFYWSQCSHCHEEMEWLKQIDEKYSNLTVNYYEVTEYTELDKKVREYFEIETESVPLTIIGNDYFIGYSSASNAKFMTSIENYTSFDSCNIVKKIENNEDVSSCYDINYNG